MEADNGEKFVTWRALVEREQALREEFGRGTNEIVVHAFNSVSLLVAIAAVVIALTR